MTYDTNNIFAKIIRGEIPCEKVYEDDHVLAFNDVNPKAPVHVLVLPKQPYISFTPLHAGNTGPDDNSGDITVRSNISSASSNQEETQPTTQTSQTSFAANQLLTIKLTSYGADRNSGSLGYTEKQTSFGHSAQVLLRYQELPQSYRSGLKSLVFGSKFDKETDKYLPGGTNRTQILWTFIPSEHPDEKGLYVAKNKFVSDNAESLEGLLEAQRDLIGCLCYSMATSRSGQYVEILSPTPTFENEWDRFIHGGGDRNRVLWRVEKEGDEYKIRSAGFEGQNGFLSYASLASDSGCYAQILSGGLYKERAELFQENNVNAYKIAWTIEAASVNK